MAKITSPTKQTGDTLAATENIVVVDKSFESVQYSATVSRAFDPLRPNFKLIYVTGDVQLAITGTQEGDAGLVDIPRITQLQITLNGKKEGNHNYPYGASTVVSLSYIHKSNGLCWFCNNPIAPTGGGGTENPIGPEAAVVWQNMSNGVTSTVDGDLFNNNQPIPSGAIASKRLGGDGSYVQMQLPDNIYGGNAAELLISDDNVSLEFEIAKSFRFDNGRIIYDSQTLTPDPLAAGTIARLTVTNLVDIAVSISPSGLPDSFTLVTIVPGVLTGMTHKYIKGLFATPGNDRQLSKVRGALVA